MAIRFFERDDATNENIAVHRFKCGDLHSLIVEQPPALAMRQFFSWSQRGVVEIFGGQQGRAFFIECWVHDSAFTTIRELDKYLVELDKLSGKHGRFEIAPDNTFDGEFGYVRECCTFVGFQRKPFDGQRLPEPLAAIGTHGEFGDDDNAYGNWHACGDLHFFQLKIDDGRD